MGLDFPSRASNNPSNAAVTRASQVLVYLTVTRGYGAGFIFAMAAWAGVVATAVYLLNAFFGERLERRWVQLVGAVLFAGSIGAYTKRTAPRLCTPSIPFR